MEFTNADTKKKLILIIIGLIVLVIIFVVVVFGVQNIMKTILIILEFIMFLAIVAGVVYAVWYIFIRKQRYDVNYVNKQRIIRACKLQNRPIMKDLYISGDSAHSRAYLGKITGWCRLQVPTRNYVYTEERDEQSGRLIKKIKRQTNERGELEDVYTVDSMEQDAFTIKKSGLLSIFEDDQVIRLDPLDHDDLVGDVTIYGFSLIPISEYLFLNSDHLDVRKIDYSILKEAERTIAFATMTDMKEVVDKATGVDAGHKKQIESKSLVETPEFRNQAPQSPYQ